MNCLVSFIFSGNLELHPLFAFSTPVSFPKITTGVSSLVNISVYRKFDMDICIYIYNHMKAILLERLGHGVLWFICFSHSQSLLDSGTCEYVSFHNILGTTWQHK